MRKDPASDILNKIENAEKEIAEIKEELMELKKGALLGGKDTSEDSTDAHIDYSLNERAFIKEYSSGFNGQRYFTLILAYLAEGKEAVPIGLLQIKKVWKNCAGIIGIPFAWIYSTRAKEDGWADVSKQTQASYVLGKHWKKIFK